MARFCCLSATLHWTLFSTTSNEERFIHGGEAMWIKRSCTELLHYRDGPAYGDCSMQGGFSQHPPSTLGGRREACGGSGSLHRRGPGKERVGRSATSRGRSGQERPVSPCLWRGPDAAPPYGARGSWALTHDESPSGGKAGWRGGSGGRGSRSRGPWPHSGQRGMSLPVHCHSHSATLLPGRAGGSGGWASSWRHGRRARAWHRWARKPLGRLRCKPWGTTCTRKRRMHACASSVLVCTRLPWRRLR